MEYRLLTVQGSDGSLGVVNVQLLDGVNLAQASDLAVHRIKSTSGLKLAQPGISILSGRRMTLV